MFTCTEIVYINNFVVFLLKISLIASHCIWNKILKCPYTFSLSSLTFHTLILEKLVLF